MKKIIRLQKKVNKILIDISAKEIWDDEEINLVKEILLFCYDFLSIKKSTELSVRLTDDKEIMELNKKYRNDNSPTNVLSFCLKKNDTNKQDIETIGDIVISKDTILKELKDNEKTFKQHISHIAIHGLLHLLGYVHDNDKEAKIMENIEIKILNKLNIPNPYVGVI